MNLFFELTNVALSMGITALADEFSNVLTVFQPGLEIYDKLFFFFDQFRNENNVRVFYKFTVGSVDNYHVPNEVDISGVIMIDLDSDFVQDFCKKQIELYSLRFISFAQKLEFQVSLHNELGSIFSGNAAAAISNFTDCPVILEKLKESEIEDVLGVNQSALIGIQPFVEHKGKVFYSRV